MSLLVVRQGSYKMHFPIKVHYLRWLMIKCIYSSIFYETNITQKALRCCVGLFRKQANAIFLWNSNVLNVLEMGLAGNSSQIFLTMKFL